MEKNLITQINTEIKEKADLAKFLGFELAEVPKEILDEAFGRPSFGPEDHEGQASARAGERDWASGIASQRKTPQAPPSTYRDPLSGQPEMARKTVPDVGDFVVVNGQPTKVVDVKTMFGNNEFVYLQGMSKPIISNRLKLDKNVGKISVFKLT